jgi:hypothetical protein
MEVSILVAKILGITYGVLGLGILLNSAYYKKVFGELMKDSGFMFFGGITSLIVGFLIVNAHNVWVKDWTVVITIIGWMVLLKGVLIFVAPKFLIKFSRPMLANTKVLGLGVLIGGLLIGYCGFFA